MINKAYKFRIFPDKEQIEYIKENQSCCRIFYNLGLNINYRQYNTPLNTNIQLTTSLSFSMAATFSYSVFVNKGNGKKNNCIIPLEKVINYSGSKIRKQVTEIINTEKYRFMKRAYSQSLNNMIHGNEGNLDVAFKKFFEGREKKDGTGFPKFKKRKDDVDVSLFMPKGSVKIDKNNSFITIPLSGIAGKEKLNNKIKICIHRPIEGTILSSRISSSHTGKYFISFAVECEKEEKIIQQKNNAVGADFGIKHLATLSTGEKIENNKYYRKSEKKLKKLNKKKDKKAFKRCNTCNFVIKFKDKINHHLRNCPTCKTPLTVSKNYLKVKNQVSRHGEHVKNQRNDFLHKQSRKLVENNSLVVLENLSIKNMSKNSKLSKAILDTGWSGFVSMLEYKGQWHNCKVVKIDRFFASSKICHCCGYKNEKLKLSQRSWICSNCKAELDRDLNAAINILFKHLSDILIRDILTQNPCNINYVFNFLNINFGRESVGLAQSELKPVETALTAESIIEPPSYQPKKQEMFSVREQLLLQFY